MNDEKNYLNSLFLGVSVDSAPIRDTFEKNFTAKNFKVSFKNLDEQIKQVCKKFNCSEEIFFMNAYALLLAKFLCAEEVLFSAESEKNFPVFLTFSSELKISDSIKNLQEQIKNSREIIQTPCEEIFKNYNFPVAPEFIFSAKCNEEKNFALSVDENFCTATIIFDGGKYSYDLIESFAAAYKKILEEFLTKEKISDVDILTAEELEKLKKIHDTDWKVEEKPAYRLLQDSAEKFPEKIAAIANGKFLTYSELNAAANRLGHFLRENGVGVEKIVGLILNRGLEVYIARQGILKSGGAFLAMTPDYPDERIKFIVEDAKVEHLVTTKEIYLERKNFFDSLNIFICFVEETQTEKTSAENLNVDVHFDALAYCIYTSGSTGKPKGVMLTQKNLVSFVDGNPKNHEILGYIERGKVSLALAAITFDVSIMEEFIPLAHGLTICMANEEEIHNPLSLKKLCEENKVDVMSCTPSYLANLIDLPEFESVIKKINSVDFGAEAFPSALFTKLRAINPKIYIMNGYGPTEATISCTMKAIESAENITIGFPNSNVKVVMTDEKNRPLPIGALGEMTILGDGVGRGYINRDEQTKKVFINLWDKPAYKSGDLARLLPNGEIVFHGRTDNQVKLRGLRVELGEIETVLNNFDGIKSSVVVVKKNSAGDYLAGYFTAEKNIDLDELKKYLAASLTAYMVPGVLMQLEKFPLTANGKIDKKSLPEPVLQVEETEIKIPTTDLQKTLCEIFAKALGRKNIGADENFFEIGGTSLSASKVAMSAYLKKLPIVYADIFKYPTAESLEKFILSKKNSAPLKVKEKIPPQKISAPIHSSVKSFLDEVFQIENALAKNRAEFVDEIRHEGLGDVLLTGATGFLGIHVLYSLLKSTSAKIFAFVRSGKNILAEDRLKNLFVYYFNSLPEKIFDERVTVINGDITDAEKVNALMDYPFKTLINCAACVKHFAADDVLTKINVEGVQNLINLCVNKKSRLIQISTVSVAGDNVDGKFSANEKLCENDFYIGQEVTTNKYVYSKFQAEEIILSAIGQGNLDAKIMRVGNLMSRISDGEFQINFMTNAFMRDLRSYATIGKFPVSKMDEQTEFSPIDETAKMIVELADTNKNFTVYHVVNSHRVQMGDVIHAMNDYGIKIEVVPDEIFNAALTEAMRDEKKSLLVSNLIAYNEDANHTVEEIDHEDIFTIKALYRLNCRWSITDDKYIGNAIKALDTLGFFEGKLNGN